VDWAGDAVDDMARAVLDGTYRIPERVGEDWRDMRSG
jgi:hypothetical protein